MPKAAVFALLVPIALSAQITTTLSPATSAEFEKYLAAAEPRITGTPRFAQIKPGETRVDAVKDDGAIHIKDGLVHDWVAATLIPGATPEQVLAVLQNYPAYKTIYKPEIIESKLLSHEGEVWRPKLRIIKKKVLTAVLDSEYDVRYRNLGGNRWQMTSRSTRMVEIDDGREMPEGTGHGFLWRLNAYWLIEPRANGVYVECRTISLSRDIPFGLGFAVGPFVHSLPVESLRSTLESTVRAIKR